MDKHINVPHRENELLTPGSRISEMLAEYIGSEQNPLALLLVGIKDLKQINERLGRDRGDALIEAAGVRLTQFANDPSQSIDHVARMPGREFLLIVRNAPQIRALEALGHKILDVLATDFGGEADPLYISTRIGIVSSEPAESGTELLHRGRIALSSAYARKGKKIGFAEFTRSRSAKINSAVDAGLRAAIKNHAIKIVFQPQFEVNSGHLVGVEALARMQHDELGEIGADQLFAAADRCDLREELSHIIQAEAIALAAKWPAALDDLRLSLNLGAEELTESYCKKLEAILLDTGFVAERLTLELTEESLVRNIELATTLLEQLRAKHIRIAVDDFGTGYSSLAYLKDLPLDYLKIDKGMTPDISGTGKDRIVLRAIIAMGQALGLKIIAEGVEREEELEMLKAEGCDLFQGYLRSVPLNADDFEKFALRSN
jgi:diguanylate cyclase (GGDEF)-like protein